MDVATNSLTGFATDQQRRFDAATVAKERKARGHFGTPAVIAEFMAGLFSTFPTDAVRILDPGAGVGTLSAAVCQEAMNQGKSCSLLFELWENDPNLIPLLESTMQHCQCSLREAGHDMEYVIREDDFILANAPRSLFQEGAHAAFDLAILNPPYFKLRKDSLHARAMQHVVHGQPNIYALFMAVAAEMLLPNGELVAITPRSYCNGPYFRRFRKWFFDRLTIRQIHLFQSRKDAFKNDAVLQENIILHAEKGGDPEDVLLSTSAGRDLLAVSTSQLDHNKVVDDRHGDRIIRVCADQFEDDIVDAMDNLPNRFPELGFSISTGPVVTFRATSHLRDERAKDTAPLLWMHNVRPFVTQFPPKQSKPGHVQVSEASRKLLVPAKTYVLLKRFTAKEEKRRLVAGVMVADDSYSEWVGLENHLNYVYRRDSELSQREAYGLAAFFNSTLVDRYFRAISGNTQVNATEIRGMPVPTQAVLEMIGEEIQQLPIVDCEAVERVVAEALKLPTLLAARLVEAVL